jgi:predicted permease
MTWIRVFFKKLGALLRPDRAEREMARELSAHLSILEEQYQRRGMPAVEARVAARRALGSLELAKELHRDARSLPWLEDLRRDVPYAIRGFRRHPAFSIAAVLTLALGVGATAAIFTILNAIVWRPLPYRDSDRLVQIAENVVRQTPAGPRYSRRFGLTQAEFLDWRARSTTLSHMAGVINLMSGTLQTSEGTIPAPRAIVSPALFDMLGVPAQLGRTLTSDDERPDAEAAVISAAAWQQLYGSDPSVLGRQVLLNNTRFTIVGVMPPQFAYPERVTMFWTPLAPRPGPGTNAFGNALARLKDGVSLSIATGEANAIGPALRTNPPAPGFGAGGPPPLPASATMGGQLRQELDLSGHPRFETISVKDQIVNPIKPQMRILAAAVVVVWLIACGNVANLLLARGTARQREMGVRLALGAGRGRIVRQILTENLVLATAGGLGGAALAAPMIQLVKALATVETPRLFQLSINLGDGSLLPRIDELGIDGTLMVYALLIAAAASIVFGLAPALYLSGPQASGALRVGTTRADSNQGSGGRLRNVLAIGQVTLATALLVAAGLLLHSFVRLLGVDTGYDARNVVTFQLLFPPQTAGERQLTVIQQVLEQLNADARVAAAGYTNIPPFLAVTEYGGLFVPPGATREQMLDDPLRPQTRIVSHSYLQAVGSRLLDGRLLNDGDTGAQTPVFVVNRALAQRYFSGRNPVGALVRIYRDANYAEDWQIVGVVDDMKQARLDQQAFPVLYADMRQVLAVRDRMPKNLQTGMPLSGFPTIAVRVKSSPQAIAAGVRQTVRGVDAAMNVDSIVDLESLRFGSLVRPRFYAVLVGLFATIAGAVAIVGIYGVLAYAVVQRTHEIGIRMALGADRRAVLTEVLRRGTAQALVGVVVGLAVAAAVTRYLSTMIYDLTPFDAATYAAVGVVFMAVAGLASYIPARRATKVDPLVALRTE